MALKTRLFNLAWDNSKLPRLEYSERMQRRVAEGVQFATGIVSLSNGVVFESLGEMETNLKAYGKVELIFQDEQVKSQEQAI